MEKSISEELLENSVPIERLAKVSIELSSGKILKVTNTATNIVGILNFVENPKNRFLDIGGVRINISQIAYMQLENVNSYATDRRVNK
nr:MAG TPA: hypothetical protein [Caudoviricetes sp.]